VCFPASQARKGNATMSTISQSTLPIEKLRARLSINLPPAASEDVLAGVRQQLNSYLLRYSYDFRGVVISYEDERVMTKQARVLSYFPYFQVSVSVTLAVFKPIAGGRIAGEVNQVGDDYIGLLVMGVFNASIAASNMGGRFTLQGDHWRCSSDASHTIEVGTLVCFVVEGVHEAGEFFSMSGSLAEADTGAVAHLTGSSVGKEKENGAAPRKDKQEKKKAKAKPRGLEGGIAGGRASENGPSTSCMKGAAGKEKPTEATAEASKTPGKKQKNVDTKAGGGKGGEPAQKRMKNSPAEGKKEGPKEGKPSKPPRKKQNAAKAEAATAGGGKGGEPPQAGVKDSATEDKEGPTEVAGKKDAKPSKTPGKKRKASEAGGGKGRELAESGVKDSPAEDNREKKTPKKKKSAQGSGSKEPPKSSKKKQQQQEEGS